MKIESFDTPFAAPADQLTRDEIISILIDDDLQDLNRSYMRSWIADLLMDGFVGYQIRTTSELAEEYTSRRNWELSTFGTDAENGMVA